MVASPNRLTPQHLVSRVGPDSPWRAWLFRSLAGAFTGVLAMLVFSWMRDAWTFLIAGVVTALAVWRSDGASVHDLLSALWARRTAGRSVTLPQNHEVSTVRVADLSAGDRVCLADEVRERVAEHERQVAERKAEAERRNTAMWEAYERQRKLHGDRGSTAPPPSPHLPQPVPLPTVREREVIAIRPEPSDVVRIGFTGGRIIKQAPDDDIIFRRRGGPVLKRNTEQAGRALEELLVQLKSQQRSERDLVTTLITAGHPRSAIRHALRAAIAARLIRRQTRFLQFFGRILRALTHGPDNNWQGEACELSLTPLGELWLTATPIPDHQTPVPPEAAP